MTCKNCQTNLTETDFYCNICGAKIINNRLTIASLFTHFSEQFLNYDNKFLQTFIHLFTKPEGVIDPYINGTRKKYVNAISYFAIALTLAGLQLYFINKFFPEAYSMTTFRPGQNEAGLVTQKQILDISNEYQSIIMMFYIPFYALLSKLTFFNIKKYNYTEHLVIFMYVQAQITIVGFLVTVFLLVSGVPFTIISFIQIVFLFLYSAYCLAKLYKQSLGGIVLRSLLFLAIAFIFTILLIIITLTIMYITGDLQTYIEAQKAAFEAAKKV